MGAHLNAYSTREHTAYYIKALSKDLPKGNAYGGDGRDGDSTPGVQRSGVQEPLARPKSKVTLGVWPRSGQPGVPGLGVCAVTGLWRPTWHPHLSFCIQLWNSWRT